MAAPPRYRPPPQLFVVGIPTRRRTLHTQTHSEAGARVRIQQQCAQTYHNVVDGRWRMPGRLTSCGVRTTGVARARLTPTTRRAVRYTAIPEALTGVQWSS